MKRIRCGIPALAAVILCLLSGCGGRDEPRLGVDGYVYTAEVLEEGNIPNIVGRNFAAAGGWLYYMENPSTLKRISLEEAEGGTGLAGGETVLTVSDTGIGIPPEHRERIFERFYRVDKSHSKEIGGTGLGLSIVKHAARLHHAEIDLKSVVEVGTTVTVKFPKNG